MTAATSTLASLEHERARQWAIVRLLRPLGAGVVGLVVIAGITSRPGPALSGRGLGVLLSLVGFAAGVLAFTRGRDWPASRLAPLFILLALSSASLTFLQPGGSGILGCFVAVSGGAMRLSGRAANVIAVVAFVTVTTAAGVSEGRSATAILLTGSGVLAFYTIARLANRLRAGQDQAMALVAELEASQRALAETAALAERQRLARDMHDVLAHSLSGLVLQLEGARLLATSNHADPELTAAVDRALHLGKAGLEEARRAIGMLRDDELPGPERLPALVSDFQRDAGVPCSFDVAGDERPLGSVARLTLYRVAQEALTNVRRHAGHIESVVLHLAYEPEGTRLIVEDFGSNGAAAGATPLHAAGGGYGITGMRERAELLGGHLQAAPTAQGFRVELWVPA